MNQGNLLGWGAWKAGSPTTLVYLQDELQIIFGLVNIPTKEVKKTFDWRSGLRRLGECSFSTGYNRVELHWGQTHLDLEYATEAERFVANVIGCSGSSDLDIELLVEFRVDVNEESEIEVVHEAENTLVRISTVLSTWYFHFSQAASASASASTTALESEIATPNTLFFKLTSPLLVTTWSKTEQHLPVSLEFESATKWLVAKKQEAINEELTTGGWLAEAGNALERVINWNTIVPQETGQPCTVVSRDWCEGTTWGSYVLFGWDSFFNSLMAVQFSPQLAVANVKAILGEITGGGFVPNFGSGLGRTEDRSQPPIGAYAVLKLSKFLYLNTQDKQESHQLLSQTFEELLGWHNWWKSHRDGNQDGLLEWGSNAMPPDYRWGAGNIRAAMWESGMDNSPMYDGVVFNSQTHTMELADVGLNALYALDKWALAEIARELNYQELATRLQTEYEELGRLINRELWNEQAGIYQNKFWDGRFSPVLSPTLFYPLLAGIVPVERAKRLVNEHLLNPAEFWGKFVIPSTARNSSGYLEADLEEVDKPGRVDDYWRGRIWPPLNFLVGEGLRRYGFDREAHELARRSLELLRGEWMAHSHIHENYHPETGQGDDVPNSLPIYTWGALLALIGIQELVDVEGWGGWRFGNFSTEVASVKNIRTQDGLLDVTTGANGLTVLLNQRLLLATDQPLIARNYHWKAGELEFTLKGHNASFGRVKVHLGQLPPNQKLDILLDKDNANTTTGLCLFSSALGEVELNISLPTTLKVRWQQDG